MIYQNLIFIIWLISPSATCSWINIFFLFLSWNNISINQSGKFTVSVKFRLTIRVRCFYISVIHLPFPSDFRDNLWVGLGILG